MRVKTDDSEIELSVEELRHFNLKNANDVKRFKETIENKKEIGFQCVNA